MISRLILDNGIIFLLMNKNIECVRSNDVEYLLIKKQFNQCHQKLCFGMKKLFGSSKYLERNYDILIHERWNEVKRKDAKVILLHPKKSEFRVLFTGKETEGQLLYWREVDNVTDDFYFGGNKCAVVLVVFGKV